MDQVQTPSQEVQINLFVYKIVLVLVGNVEQPRRVELLGIATDPKTAADLGMQLSTKLPVTTANTHWRAIGIEECGPCTFGPIAQPDKPILVLGDPTGLN